MEILNKDQFTNTTDREIEPFATPELGEDTGVHIRGLSAKGQEAALKRYYPEGQDAPPDPLGIIPFVCRLGVVDEKGEPLFSEEEGVAIMEEKGPELLQKIFLKICSLSGMEFSAGTDKAPEVDTDRENLSGGQLDDSPSD